jgi:hypothetical protein
MNMDCCACCMELTNTQNPNNLLRQQLRDSPYVLQIHKPTNMSITVFTANQRREDTDNSGETM